MKVIVKEEWKEAEKEFYKIPKEEREGVIFWSAMDFISGMEYEVLSIEKNSYRIIDESGEDYLFPSEMFNVVRTN